ncbi:N-acetylmuramoyl-L-alanine amidase [Nocardia sp. CA-135953]|uniref:N-acetylmuramoyl-L-alanine amidase n=1 Tax=Nocardia sp. CA-135953 TaxID=3239978 RepID=UPI003D962E3C
MADPVWLPDVLRAKGLVVHEYPGWRERGHGDFGNIWGVVCHHTGSFGETAHGIAEHPDLGLASQLFLSPDGEFTICGAGIAWHAGAGSYPGISRDAANNCTIGIEAANDGGGTPGKPHRTGWSDKQYNAYTLGVAAILEHLGEDSSHAIGHKEWAGAAQGKWDPGAIDMDIFRSDVQSILDNGGSEMPALQETFKNYKGDTVTVGTALFYLDQYVNEIREQLGGPVPFTGWKQLGDKTVVDSLADAHRKIDALTDLLSKLVAAKGQ